MTEPLRFRRLDSVTMRSISWLDRPLWQRAAFQLVIGRKGVGKGTYVAGLAARVTLGELYEQSMNVLVLASEDSDEIDIKPRIVAAGGEPSRVHTLDEAMLLPRDVPRLRAAALEIGDVGLIILDPIASYVRGDTHAEEPVRNAIDPLNGLANELDCLLLGVRHLGEKDATKGALAATLGASAWVQVPRAVLAVAADDEEDLLFHIAVAGGNRSARGAGRVFRIDLVDVAGLAEPITRATEIGTSAKSVDELLGDGDDRKRKAPKREGAREIILRELALEPQSLDFLKAKCIAELGVSGETVWRAANELKSERLVETGNSGIGTPWLWFVTSPRARGDTTNDELTDFVTKSPTSSLFNSPEDETKSSPAESLFDAGLNGSEPPLWNDLDVASELAWQEDPEPVTRRSRVPGTSSSVWRREVACGIDPAGALVRALAEFRAIRAGEVWRVGVGHDDGCPAIDVGPMAACTCELVRLEARRAA